MEKTYWGLGKTAFTICIGVPCIIGIVSFLNTGELNVPGTFIMVLIMIGFAKLFKMIAEKIKRHQQ